MSEDVSQSTDRQIPDELFFVPTQLHEKLLEYFETNNVDGQAVVAFKLSGGTLVPMANLAYSLGLLAKSWLEILKRMAQLRNKFAHAPLAVNFEELAQSDPKSVNIFESLKQRYKLFPGNEGEEISDFKQGYLKIFNDMYSLTQFAIDHISIPQSRQPLDSHLIVGIANFAGFNKNILRSLLNQKE